MRRSCALLLALTVALSPAYADPDPSSTSADPAPSPTSADPAPSAPGAAHPTSADPAPSPTSADPAPSQTSADTERIAPITNAVTSNTPNKEGEPSRRGLALSAAGVAGIYAGLYGWVTLAWYRRTTDSPTFQFHDEGWFAKDSYAGGSDKLGHGWTTYLLTRGVSKILHYGGWSRRGSLAAAGALSLTFLTFAEIKDGYKVEYGFSYGDQICNILGVGIGVAFELLPELDRRIDLRVSYLPSSDYIANFRKDGFDTQEDYTGQTYLLAYHLGSIDLVRRRAGWARFFDLNVGYQAVNYRPIPTDSRERSQELFVGASLNLQEMFDSILDPSTGANVLHFVTEMYQVPYTTLRVGGLERTAPPIMPATP